MITITEQQMFILAHKKAIAEKDKEINKLENKLAEKDKEINKLIEDSRFDIKVVKDLLKDIKQLKQQQLYKEDFEKLQYLERDYEGGYILKGEEIRENDPELIEEMLILKDNSKYDTLPSKEELK